MITPTEESHLRINIYQMLWRAINYGPTHGLLSQEEGGEYFHQRKSSGETIAKRFNTPGTVNNVETVNR